MAFFLIFCTLQKLRWKEIHVGGVEKQHKPLLSLCLMPMIASVCRGYVYRKIGKYLKIVLKIGIITVFLPSKDTVIMEELLATLKNIVNKLLI